MSNNDEASFVKELRSMASQLKDPVISKRFTKAADLIERLQSRIKNLYAGDLSPESRFNGYKVITEFQEKRIEELRAEIKKLKESGNGD